MKDLAKYRDKMIEHNVVSLESQPETDSENTPDVIKGIMRRWYIVLLIFIMMCLVGLPSIWFLIKPLYKVTGAIRVAPILENIVTGEEGKGGISNYKNYMYTQAALIASSPVVQRVADDLKDKDLSYFTNQSSGLVSKLIQKLKGNSTNPEIATVLKGAISGGAIKVIPGDNTELIEIIMESESSDEAERIVDAFIRAYMAVEYSSSIQEQDDKLVLLEDERKVKSDRLQSQREEIRQLAQEYGSATLLDRQDMMLQRVNMLLSNLEKVESSRIDLEIQVQLLEQFPERIIAPEDLLKMRGEYINANMTVRELTRNVIQLERDLIIARQTLSEEHHLLQQQQELLDALQLRLEQERQEVAEEFDTMISQEIVNASNEKLYEAKAELEQTKVHEERLRQLLTEEDTETIKLGRTQLDIQDLQFRFDLDRERYEAVCRRIQELEMERKRPARVAVAYYADIESTQDRRIKYIMAFMFGSAACGMLLAFLRDKADLRLHTPNDVSKHIGIRIIGTTTSSHNIKPALLAEHMVGDYQAIRANLGLLHGEGMPKKLIVTSPGMREGKTAFAVNLATSMSRAGKKVLLIDGDLRRPDIAHVLNMPEHSSGLQDVLLGKELDEAVYTIASSGLDVLAADSRSRIDSYELLASLEVRQCIEMISQKYDNVIIDTPALLAFPDALIWAKFGDAVILTGFAGQTTTPELREAKERLTEINVTVLGMVLSNVQSELSSYHYQYNH